MEFRVRQAVVMVGGKGTRLLPLTETKPKPILPVADRPCIWYLVRSLARAGIEEVILACGYRPGEMEALGDGSDLGVRIVYSYEDEPLGTAGAMKLIEDRLDEVFVAANGDVFADIDVAEEIRVHMDTGAAITIALTPVENPCEFGIARVDDTGAISEFREKPRPEEVFSNLINAGVYVMDRSVLGHVPEGVFFDFSRDLVPRVMADGGRIQGYNLDGVWMDVGRPHDLLGANLSTASREYADAEWPTVTGSTTEGRIYVGEGSRVDGSSLRESAVLCGSTVTSSELDNVLVMRGCSIDGAVLSNTIVGDGCEIRRGARVTNAVLADNTVIGEDTVLDGGRVV